jgi:hypothetical protein
VPKNEQLAKTAGDWIYSYCHCFVDLHPGRQPGVRVTREGGVCALCGNNNVRFVHTLEYLPDIDQQKPDAEVRRIDVGIDCARELLGPDDWELPGLAENETKRKERWRRVKFHTPGRCVTTVEDLEERGKL